MFGIFTYIYHNNQPFMYRYIYPFPWILWVLTWSCTRRTGRSWSTLRRDQLEGSTGLSHKTLWVQWYIIHLGGGFKYCICSPRSLGKWSNLTNIFQMGWFNHQLVIDFIPYPGYSWLEICTKNVHPQSWGKMWQSNVRWSEHVAQKQGPSWSPRWIPTIVINEVISLHW